MHPGGMQRQDPAAEKLLILNQALVLHQAGRLAEAQKLYLQILAVDARHADALHLLGMVENAMGHAEIAVKMIRRAIASNGNNARYYSNLGFILENQELHGEAEIACKQALLLNPNYAEALNNLGNALLSQGRVGDAAASYRQALELKPDHAEAHYNLGNALSALGTLDEAIASYKTALKLKPGHADAWNNLGHIFEIQGKPDEAVACYEQAITFKPDFAEALINLGNALRTQGKFDAAIACYQRGLALKPGYADAYTNLGNTLKSLGKLEEAIACFEKALALKPNNPEACYNLGNVLKLQGKLSAAVTSYEQALALRPDYADAHLNRALALLLQGDFANGWSNYDWRWKHTKLETVFRTFEQPRWTGERLSSGRLLIWAEQGVGDEIMFASLIPDVIRRESHCVLDCDPRLQSLFARSFPSIEVVSKIEPQEAAGRGIAAQLPSGSLPALFRNTEADFTATVSPYLFADAALRSQLRSRYADGRRLVGLAWHTKNPSTGRYRSLQLDALAGFFAVPQTKWINLQYGDFDDLENQITKAKAPILIDRSVDQMTDLDLFAAQIAAMDLVITIDNSTAHLAGALGIPVWLLLPCAPDWRWMLGRSDSPWYPSMRLFRQPTLGDWPSVIEAVQCALREEPATK